MNRARAALLLALSLPLAALVGQPASAGQGRGPLSRASDRQAIVLIEDRVSFEQLMRGWAFEQLARMSRYAVGG